MNPTLRGTRDDALAVTVQASVGTQFSLATIRAIIDAADRARAGDSEFGGEGDWPCDKYDEPQTCLTARADMDDLCRICRIRAADRLLAALARPTDGGTPHPGGGAS